MEVNRRKLIGRLACFIAAPAIVRVSSLMPAKAWREPVIGIDLASGSDMTACHFHIIGVTPAMTQFRFVYRSREGLVAQALVGRRWKDMPLIETPLPPPLEHVYATTPSPFV